MAQTRFKLTDLTFNQVADLYLAQLRQGVNPPTIDAVVEAFPHLESQLREQLPSLALLEKTLAPTSNNEIELGSRLGGCELLRELGRGAMGIVYEAFDLQLGQKVAVKVSPLEAGASSMVAARFELERHAMARVEHPNIVPVYSYGHDNHHVYLVMKLIEGYSLYDLQGGGGDFRIRHLYNELYNDWNALANLGVDVAGGLQHSHDQGLVHRDIKPGNLLLDQVGKIWISDFGLAKVFDYARCLSRTGDVIGTPRYMAPEQLRGACDGRVDVYSLGLTLYELATGGKAWGEKTDLKLLIERNSVSLPDPRRMRPDFPESLSSIIMKACQFAPEDRYQSAGELQIVLERFLAGARPSDRRRKKREPDEVFRKKSAVHTLISMVFVTLLTFCVGVLFFMRRGEDRAFPKVTGMANVHSQDFRESDFGKLDELTNKSLDKFFEGYREASLPQAIRVLRLSVLISNSGMSEREQEVGIGILRRLAALLIDGLIDERQVDKLINELAERGTLDSEQIFLTRVTDRELRSWLEKVCSTINLLPTAPSGSGQDFGASQDNTMRLYGDD